MKLEPQECHVQGHTKQECQWERGGPMMKDRKMSQTTSEKFLHRNVFFLMGLVKSPLAPGTCCRCEKTSSRAARRGPSPGKGTSSRQEKPMPLGRVCSHRAGPGQSLMTLTWLTGWHHRLQIACRSKWGSWLDKLKTQILRIEKGRRLRILGFSQESSWNDDSRALGWLKTREGKGMAAELGKRKSITGTRGSGNKWVREPKHYEAVIIYSYTGV